MVTSLFTIGQTSSEFYNFIESKTSKEGSVKFETICSMDSMFTENPETGEFEVSIAKAIYEFTKGDTFKSTIENGISAGPFVKIVYNEFGEESGKQSYHIEFTKTNDTFDIKGITDDQKRNWKKIGDCWTIVD
jgi:hypothetical protein